MPRGDRNQWTGVTPEQRFLNVVDRRGDDECWPWKLTPNNKGRETPRNLAYGRVTIGKRRMLAHRFAYELFVGPIPEGYTIDHLCENPSCVNPAHLEAVTMKENLHRGNGACMRRHRARLEREGRVVGPSAQTAEQAAITQLRSAQFGTVQL